MIYNFFKIFLYRNPIAFVALILAPISMILETNIIPYGLKVLVDEVSAQEKLLHIDKSISVFYYPLFIIIVAWVTKEFIIRFCHYIEIDAVPKLQSNIRIHCFRHVLGHSYSFFLNNLSGDVANKINNLPNSSETIRNLVCWNIFSSVVMVIFSSLMLTQVGYQIPILLICWISIHSVLIYYFVGQIEVESQKHAESQSILNGQIVDSINNIESIKTYSHKKNNDYILLQQQKEIDCHKAMLKKIWFFQVASDIPVLVLILSVFYCLIQSWKQNMITIGDFILVFNIIISVMYNIIGLGYVLTDIFREFGRIKQSLSLLMLENADLYNINFLRLNLIKGDIRFLNVKFGYNCGKSLFNNLNCAFLPYQKTCIVGPSGSGKSSLIKLLFKFYDVQSGSIEIDGQNICNISTSSLREQITYVAQDVKLFHQSIRFNIAYGMHYVSIQKIMKAAKSAYIHEFINSLPDGYDTIVGENGYKLSGGQRQRIILARAFLKNSKIIIFDEVTSAQDIQTEQYLQNSINLFCKNKTLIFITHKLSIIKKMDKIIFLQNGKIIGEDTHENLLKNCCEYKKFIEHENA